MNKNYFLLPQLPNSMRNCLFKKFKQGVQEFQSVRPMKKTFCFNSCNSRTRCENSLIRYSTMSTWVSELTPVARSVFLTLVTPELCVKRFFQDISTRSAGVSERMPDARIIFLTSATPELIVIKLSKKLNNEYRSFRAYARWKRHFSLTHVTPELSV